MLAAVVVYLGSLQIYFNNIFIINYTLLYIIYIKALQALLLNGIVIHFNKFNINKNIERKKDCVKIGEKIYKFK